MTGEPAQARRQRVVLTGAWGAGKTTFLDELAASAPAGIIILPEAAPLVRRMGFDIDSARFQAAVVTAQHALEEIAEVRDGAADDRLVITHRGSLDALAFWLRGGRTTADFFTSIASTLPLELSRYDAVILFESCASGAADVYERYRQDHARPPAGEAERLDALLAECWGPHPRFHRLANGAGGWAEKRASAQRIIETLRHRC